MAKTKSRYRCQSCGAIHPRWMGKCPDCAAWDTLEAETVTPAGAHGGMAAGWTEVKDAPDAARGGKVVIAPSTPRAVALPEITMTNVQRLPSGVAELDRVLGGGFVPGSVTLLGGDPGIGKSTLLLQAAARLAATGARVLYVSTEESADQTRLRAERLFAATDAAGATALDQLSSLFVLADTEVDRIVAEAQRIRPAVLMLDSVQMAYTSQLEASPGSVAQLRRCCTELVYLAKVSGMAVVLVGHVTKDGQLAGPKLLEHLVDTVLSFEGDRHHHHRVVRGIKNRFGATFEVGLFEMTGQGLAEVSDPGATRDPERPPAPGSVVCPVLHGSRCLVVEVQALTTPGFPGTAKRKTSGLDTSRLAMLTAVLERHATLRLADQDIFTSAVGGLRINEPAADLAIALAIAGAFLRRRVPAGTAVVGEVGLGGEIRVPAQLEARQREAGRLGFKRLVAPAGPDAVRTIADAVEILDPA